MTDEMRSSSLSWSHISQGPLYKTFQSHQHHQNRIVIESISNYEQGEGEC
jgi:hypothetical protein